MLLGCPECAGAVQNPDNFFGSSIVSAWGTYVYALDNTCQGFACHHNFASHPFGHACFTLDACIGNLLMIVLYCCARVHQI